MGVGISPGEGFGRGAASFALGVQWHAEYDAASDPVNRALFAAFGAAARAVAAG